MTLSELIMTLTEIERKGHGNKDVMIWSYSSNEESLVLTDLDENEIVYSKTDKLIIIND